MRAQGLYCTIGLITFPLIQMLFAATKSNIFMFHRKPNNIDDIQTKLALIKKLNIAVFMTTHQSNVHQDFLQRCWKTLISHIPLLNGSDLIYYTPVTPIPVVFNLGFRRVAVKYFNQTTISETDSWQRKTLLSREAQSKLWKMLSVTDILIIMIGFFA
jgi:hypothetical protein